VTVSGDERRMERWRKVGSCLAGMAIGLAVQGFWRPKDGPLLALVVAAAIVWVLKRPDVRVGGASETGTVQGDP
jgi:hypothetical protein